MQLIIYGIQSAITNKLSYIEKLNNKFHLISAIKRINKDTSLQFMESEIFEFISQRIPSFSLFFGDIEYHNPKNS